ncbi:MAG TPA: copper-binding protein [Polaromonas sp.]|nr:copper-binding protein [Polaromonas sp.]
MKCVKPALAALLASSLFSTFSAFAQAPLPQTEGEVRNIDQNAGKITLKHGEIKNLGMPPMSMVFKAKDPALLNKVKAGDKVRFTADQVNGTLTLVSIEPSK